MKTFLFFFWSLPEFGEKSGALFLVKTFFFWSFNWISAPEQNRGRGSSPQCWKYGKIGVKLQIIPSNAQQRSAPLAESES